MMNILLNTETFFRSGGKAPVVLCVALIVILGLGIWLFLMDKRIRKIENQIENNEKH
tara:strand:- start:236 stop:406 length:171 start_codon:yes stop_codon:yes gene_type:complete